MIEYIKSFLEVILNQRLWSWSVIGILYVLVAFVIRERVMQPLVRRAKELNARNYKRVKTAYLKRSIWGWFFFVASGLNVIALWENWAYPLGDSQYIAILGAVSSFILCVVFHLGAFGSAALASFKKAEEE